MSKPCLGTHISVAGGLDKGVARAVALDCDCIQVFTKNANTWKATPLQPATVAAWQQAWKASGMRHPIAHASYLINLAAPDAELYEKSKAALVIEWQRCETLQIEGLVLHPGAFTSSDETSGVQRVIEAIVQVYQEVQPSHCRLLLENTAGQGSCLGARLPQLGLMLSGVTAAVSAASSALGVCLDTCHAFAAGYAIHTEDGFRDFLRELNDCLPSESVRALHLNDSKKPLGSRVDRHEHIGCGEIGLDAFRFLLNDPQLGCLPGYLETEKGIDPETGRDWDAINLQRLRSLIEA